MPLKDLKLVIVGDVHGAWDGRDEAYYSEMECDLFMWTGDLIDHPKHGHEILHSLCRVEQQNNLGILGNNDGATMPLVIAEALGFKVLAKILGRNHVHHVGHYKKIMGNADIGFARQDLDDLHVSVIGLRPFSCGGSRVTFKRALRKLYGVENSFDAVRAQIDAAQYEHLIMLGHNGPAGLGEEPHSPFGRDIFSLGGDLGDPDYADAIEYAQAQGKRVMLAIGGHMHDRLFRSQQNRRAYGLLKDTLVLNACTVSRHRQSLRYHMEVVISGQGEVLQIERVGWSDSGQEERESIITD